MNTNNAYLEAVNSLIDQLEVKKKESPESFNLTNTHELFRTVAAQFIELDIDREIFLDFANLFDDDYTDDAAARLFASLLAEMENKEPENPQKVLARFRELCRTMFGVREAKKQSVLIDGLPPFAVEIAQHIATVLQHPVDYAIGSIFVATAAVSATKWRLFDGKYYNYPQLWLCLVGDSTVGKTPILKIIFNPIRRRDAKNDNETYYPALEKWEKGDKQKPQPKRKRYLSTDSTPEVRDQLLAQCGSTCILSDEIRTFIDNLGRYEKSGEVYNLLSLYSNEGYPVDRRGYKTLHLEDPVLSIIGGIQSPLIRRVFGNPDFQDNGFIPRWLWIWDNNSDYPYRSDDEISPRIIKKWEDFIEFMDATNGVTQLRLSKGARAAFLGFDKRMKDKARGATTLDESYIYGKAEINVERWALVLHVMKCYQARLDNDLPPAELEADTMQTAIAHMEQYFIPTGLKILDSLPDTTNISKAQAIRLLGSVYPGLNRSRLAEALGVTQPFISKMLRGN